MQDGSPSSLVGSELDDRYRILSPLGEGGMGAVYLGEHMRIGRQVAIKVLDAELAKSDDFLARFEREAIAAARLDHPNCVPVTDSGHLDDGTAYLVMELVSGESLGAVLESQGPWLEPIRALRIIRHVLRGLGHAHDMGIVHRDIKPDNIMLCERDDDQDFARVLDFGIAKLRDDDSREKAALTQDGVAVGTPAYLSPEQAFGDAIDLRSDLYSCSVVLFHMLCGRAPFVADNPIGVLTKHAATKPPHLWEIAAHLEDFPSLDELVQRGLSKDRADRYQSATEFVNAIDQTLLALGAQLTPLPDVVQIPASLQTGSMPAQVPTPPPRQATATSGLSLREQTDPTLVAPQPAQRRRHLPWRALVGAVLIAGALILVLSRDTSDTGTKASIAGVDTELLLQTYQEQLKNGKTCEIRREAVEKLRVLGDARAIPSLRNARRRMRGGVLGVGKKNANRCLSKAANDAIEELKNR